MLQFLCSLPFQLKESIPPLAFHRPAIRESSSPILPAVTSLSSAPLCNGRARAESMATMLSRTLLETWSSPTLFLVTPRLLWPRLALRLLHRTSTISLFRAAGMFCIDDERDPVVLTRSREHVLFTTNYTKVYRYTYLANYYVYNVAAKTTVPLVADQAGGKLPSSQTLRVN